MAGKPPRSRPLFGLVGFGRFGRLAGALLAPHGTVVAHDPRSDAAEKPPRGVRRGTLAEAAGARVVILAVPIRELPGVLEAIAPHLVRPALVADTCSVKTLPARWMSTSLPKWVDIAATHPLFGPDSVTEGLEGLKVAFCPLRLRHPRTVRRFLRGIGLRVIDCLPEEHDRELARTQAVVHFLGRALDRLQAGPRDLDTSGYRKLLEVLQTVRKDSIELFTDMQRFNPYAPDARRELLRALESIDDELGRSPS